MKHAPVHPIATPAAPSPGQAPTPQTGGRNDRRWVGYDVIGDVHGHADKLERLLAELGYTSTAQPDHPRKQGLWGHPDRQAIFIGDLIDRGPAQIHTVDLVRAMVDAGNAQIVLGNHEFNAIAYATPNPELPGEYLRPRSGTTGKRNRSQHHEFLSQVGHDSALYRDCIAWFRRLPLWLELDGGLRVVHACWDRAAMDILERFLSFDGSLTYNLMVEGSRKGSAEYDAIETILKGPELDLPESHWYLDKEEHLRKRARVRWWDPDATTLREAADMPVHARGANGERLPPLPDTPLGDLARGPYTDDVPVLFGHYWRTKHSVICTPTTGCVDFSAGRGGPLVAYSWTCGLLDERNLSSARPTRQAADSHPPPALATMRSPAGQPTHRRNHTPPGSGRSLG